MGKALRLTIELARTQAGAFATEQANECGLSRHALSRAARAGLIERRAVGVYVAGGAPPSWRQELWVAQLAVGPRSAIGGRAAGQLLGMRGFRSDAIEVITHEGGAHRLRGGILRETFWLPEEHIITIEGLRVTTVARTCFDVAGSPPCRGTLTHPVRREVHKRWVKRVINSGMADLGLTIDGMVRVLVALGRRGKPGTAIVREILHEFGPDYVPTDTGLEFSFVDLLEANRIDQPERQVDMSDEQGWIGRVDFLYRLARLVVEIDGPEHDTPLQKAVDAARDERLRAAGWRVLRIHWLELLHNPERVIRRLMAALAA
jgi:hypothetical protein